MKAYKGFDKDLKCKDFQYEIGKEYEETEAKLCEKGFHACEYPLDVFIYYEPWNSRYCEVEIEPTDEKESTDTKICGKKIKIGAEIGIKELVTASIKYVNEKEEPSNRCHAAKNYSANLSTRDYSANSSTRYGSANSSTGDYSANSSTRNYSANSSTGDCSANSSTGNYSANSSTGNYSANSSTGYKSVNVSTGISCSNNGEGERNICVSWGKDGKCKGSIGSFLVLSEWGEYDREKHPFLGAKMVEIDGKVIKADTYYKLINGEIVESED